jgi:hypothetical protein
MAPPDLAARLGLRTDSAGAVIERIDPGSAAEPGCASPTSALAAAPNADAVFLLVSRGGQEMFVSMRRG